MVYDERKILKKMYKKNKAVIVGGSNGIGLAIGINLIKRGYFLEILDVIAPDEGLFEGFSKDYSYHYCNLLDFNTELFEELSKDDGIDFLMIATDIGRVSDFEYLHIAEIDKTLCINAVSAMKIIRVFYDRIKSNVSFYCGVMGAIAGIVSSPMFSVYAASKAAICRFVESINIELEESSVANRILNVSPGSIKGVRFNESKNDLKVIEGLAEAIVERILQREVLYIPQYDEIFKEMIDRYKGDAHGFGLESYQYQRKSGRMQNEHRVIIGYLSGTFDLFHVGHLNLLRRAKGQCDYLIVGIHESGSWKGKETFIPLDERMQIVAACKYVDRVVVSPEEDSDAWDLWHYSKLFVGSDYKGSERFKRYERLFAEKGVEIVYFPYTVGTSSTQIRESIKNRK